MFLNWPLEVHVLPRIAFHVPPSTRLASLSGRSTAFANDFQKLAMRDNGLVINLDGVYRRFAFKRCI